MKRYIPALIRIALGLIFIAASYNKILRPDQFADSINNYHILPVQLVNLAALTLPWIELLFGIFLVFRIQVASASMATTIMMTIFTAAIISAWARGIDTACGCFSAKGEPISWHEIVRDLAFLGMAVYTLALALRHPPALERMPHDRTDSP